MTAKLPLSSPATPRLPEPGAFIRPIGRVAYCLQLIKITPPTKEDPREVWEFDRWGMKDGKPFMDGHRSKCWISDLTFVRPGCWRDEWKFNTSRWACCPLYYLQMPVDPAGQMQLF
jgi:hypothetical protein